MARAEEDALRWRRVRLLDLLGQGYQHPLRLPEDFGRRLVAGYGRQPDCAEVVGLYGRHYGGQCRQLARYNPPARGVSYGLIET